MPVFALRYGQGSVNLSVEGARSLTVLEEKATPPITNLADAFRRAVTEECVESPPLRALITAADAVTIVISDFTRFWMRQDQVVSLLVAYLTEELGLDDTQITILIALGTHRPQTPEELERLVTPAIYQRIRTVNHDCEAKDLVSLGTTSRGTPVAVNPLAVGRKLILIGGTSHHLMAGFGGGRKSVVPGIASTQTIKANHLHSLSPDEARSNPLIGLAKTRDNPVDADMDEATALVAPTFGINIVVNSHNEHCRLVCGHWREAWRASCAIVQDALGVAVPQHYDTVIVSCGGYPKDINLYQAVKALHNAAQATRDGGTIAFLAECPEGGGAAEFFSWIEPLRRGELDAALRRDFTIAGYIFYATCEAIARTDVRILTAIPQDTAAAMGMRAYGSAEALQADLDCRGRDVAVIPYGGYVVPFVQ